MSRRSRTTPCTHRCISASGAPRSAASRRRSRRRSIRWAISCQACISSAARQQGDAARCTFCSTTMARFPRDRAAGLRALLHELRAEHSRAAARVHGNSRHVGRRYEPPTSELLERTACIGELRDRLRRADRERAVRARRAICATRLRVTRMTVDLSLLPDGGVGWLDASGDARRHRPVDAHPARAERRGLCVHGSGARRRAAADSVAGARGGAARAGARERRAVCGWTSCRRRTGCCCTSVIS